MHLAIDLVSLLGNKKQMPIFPCVTNSACISIGICSTWKVKLSNEILKKIYVPLATKVGIYFYFWLRK